MAGKFDFDQLDKLIVKYFRADEPCARECEPEPACEYTSEFLHVFKDINQSHIELAWGGCPYNSDDFYALNVMCSALGGGMSSRLFQTIREQHGLVYTVYSYPSFYRNCGTFEVTQGLVPTTRRSTATLSVTKSTALSTAALLNQSLLVPRCNRSIHY